MNDEYPGGWFGQSWDAPVNEEGRHLPTPVGDTCASCLEPIQDTDRGMLIPVVTFERGVSALLEAWHLECYLRNMVGDELVLALWRKLQELDEQQ